MASFFWQTETELDYHLFVVSMQSAELGPWNVCSRFEALQYFCLV